jgi:hypothetical protein
MIWFFGWLRFGWLKKDRHSPVALKQLIDLLLVDLNVGHRGSVLVG